MALTRGPRLEPSETRELRAWGFKSGRRPVWGGEGKEYFQPAALPGSDRVWQTGRA